MIGIFRWFKSKQKDFIDILDSLPDSTVKPENDDMILHTIKLLKEKGYTVFDYSSGRLRAKLNLVYIVLYNNELLDMIPEGFTREKQGNRIYIYMIPEGDETSKQNNILLNNMKMLNWAASLPNCNSATEITYYHYRNKGRNESVK